jgi:hypothetical protein
MKIQKQKKSAAQLAWKQQKSNERWERRADYLMGVFSHVSVMLPSQITHIKQQGVLVVENA